MANYAIVEIDGKEYPVSFGMNALAQFTRQAGLTLKQLSDLEEHLDLQNTLVLVWCGLKDGFRKARKAGEVQGQFDITHEDVGDILDTENGALEKIMSVFSEAMPAEGNGKPQTTKRGARKKSLSTN